MYYVILPPWRSRQLLPKIRRSADNPRAKILDFGMFDSSRVFGCLWITLDASLGATANLRTKILDFGGFDSSRVLILRGWNSHVHTELPGKLESSNRSRDNISREIGRTIIITTSIIYHRLYIIYYIWYIMYHYILLSLSWSLIFGVLPAKGPAGLLPASQYGQFSN